MKNTLIELAKDIKTLRHSVNGDCYLGQPEEINLVKKIEAKFAELLQANSEPRFFLEHGIWHDKETGQHMYSQDQYDELRRDAFHHGYQAAKDEFQVKSEANSGNAVDERFFIDHGLWHDRVTGEHLYTQDQYDEVNRESISRFNQLEALQFKYEDLQAKISEQEPVAVYETYTGNGEICAPYNRFKFKEGYVPKLGDKLYAEPRASLANKSDKEIKAALQMFLDAVTYDSEGYISGYDAWLYDRAVKLGKLAITKG